MTFNFKEVDEKRKTIAAVIVTVIILVLILLLGTFLIIGGRPRMEQSMLLYQVAYDSLGRFYRNQDDITVYIRENGEWEPFLVLEASYPGEGNGGVLMLRKYLIQERRPWLAQENRRSALLGHGGKDFRYYPMTDIDAWLETEYLQMFSPSIQERFLSTNIEVWDGLSHSGDTGIRNVSVTEIVPRRVFLLSENETGKVRGGARRAVEGEPIAYFHSGSSWFHQNLVLERRMAIPRHEYTGDRSLPRGGGTGFHGYSWWLRSVAWTEATGAIYTIKQDGFTMSLMFRSSTFIRPAFTMPRDTVIELYEVDGRMVYVIHD